MASLDLDTGAVRDSGRNVADARGGLEESGVDRLRGTGDNQRLSTMGFAPGVACDQRLMTRQRQASQTVATLINNFSALSSALHIVADLHETTEADNAARFAFQEEGAETPADLPYYLDPELTELDPAAQEYWDQYEEILREQGFEVQGGGEAAGAGDTRVEFRSYGPPGGDGPRFEVTDRYEVHADGEEQLQVREYKVTHPDGSVEYYEVRPDGEGGLDRENYWHFGPQPAPPPPNEALFEWIEEQQELRERTLPEVGG